MEKRKNLIIYLIAVMLLVLLFLFVGGVSGVKLPKDKQPAVKKPRERSAPEGGADIELYVRLRELRRQLAAKEGVPAYVIFSNATLMDMYYKQPTTDEEFLEVSGVGTYKLRSYGRAFMAIIKDYRKKKRS